MCHLLFVPETVRLYPPRLGAFVASRSASMAVGSSAAESVKPERGTYRVVHSPSVMVRDRPKGKVVGQQLLGTVVHTDMCSVGGVLGGWVRIKGGYAGGEGWMLVDGTALGLGKLLEAVPRPSLARYRVVHGPHVMVRDRPHGVVVSQRAQGRLLRTDLRTHDGWVRLEEDLYKPGSAEPCEGWVLVQGAHLLPCLTPPSQLSTAGCMLHVASGY